MRRSADQPDQWFILGRFTSDHRGREDWEAATGLALDLDYEDPTLPKEEGSHKPIPEGLRAQLAEAIATYPVPGLGYLTRRGLRWACLFAKDITDLHMYATLVEQAGQKLLQHLAENGIPLWRDGVTGLRLDTTSARPEQAMRLPLPGVEVVPTGGDYPIQPTDLIGDGVPLLDLDAALPPFLAHACRSIASGIQIAPEVVVTASLARTAAAIGNTRWVVARGLRVPLSLHYVTVVLSGSGKSAVRSVLRSVSEVIEEDVRARRVEAEREWQEYQTLLDSWRSDRRSQKRRDSAGPAPLPPQPSPKGGPRVSFTITESTVEGMFDTLADSPRGCLWTSSEAHEVLGLLGAYGDGQGKRSLDAARLRKLMGSEEVEAHRARGNAASMRHLRRPWLGIDVDVQPGLLATLFTDEDRVSGMTARFLMHAPAPLQGHRQYVDPPPPADKATLERLRECLVDLWGLPLQLDEDLPVYEELTLEPAAERLWAEELERLERLYPWASEQDASVLGHARGRILRLAGVLALVRDARVRVVTEIDVRRALAHMRYHMSHYRRFKAAAEAQAGSNRSDRLRQQVQEIYDRQQDVGVRPTDLRHRTNQKLYAGDEGLRRAYADLHALGWILRRPPSQPGRPGRRHVPAFFPPTRERPSAKSGKPQPPADSADSADDDCSRSRASGREAAADLLRGASEHLLALGLVELPPRGERVACPACGSPDGLGVLPDDSVRWYCHSERHDGPRSGCAVDHLLAQELGRMPSVAEAVAKAKEILGHEPERGARCE